MVVWGKHGTEIKDILIMHFIAKSYAHSGCCLTSGMATARSWAEFLAINDVVRPHIIYERYRLVGK